jgi:hypothetical protein
VVDATAIVCAVIILRIAIPGAEYAGLSDEQLVAAYKQAWPEHRSRLVSNPSFSAWRPETQFARLRDEIVRRGGKIVPALLGILRTDDVRGEPRKVVGISDSLAEDLLEALVEINDPRAVPAALEFAGDSSGRTREWYRLAALYAIERLTHCSMRRAKPFNSHASASVPHPTALDVEWFSDTGPAVERYRTWLTGEGADPTRWAALARNRAEARLAGDDPDAVYLAAEYLRNFGGDRAAVANRLAAVLPEIKRGPKPFTWVYREKPSSMPVANWSQLLSQFGRLARPHAKTLIRVQKDHGENAWSFYAQLREVGGEEIIAYLFSVLPRVSAEVAKIKADPKTPKAFRSDDPRGWWFDSLREIQLACDRWAGRRFDTDVDRVAWWEVNRGHPRAEWLGENLGTVVIQADAGDPWASWVAKEVLPDMPRSAPLGETWKGYRSRWVMRNRTRLHYDPEVEAFRLRVAGK